VAAYNFDQGSGTTLTDISGNGNNGTIANAAWTSSGKYGKALKFTGAVNSMVTINDTASLNFAQGMTLEAWVNPSSLNFSNGWCTAIAKEHANSNNNISYALYAADGPGAGPSGHVLIGNADNDASTGSVLSLNSWTFLAATYDGANLDLYVNGNLIASRIVGGNILETTDPLRIGGDAAGEMFTGLIDNVRIYNQALSQSSIQTDMNTPVASSAASLTVTPATLAKATANTAYNAKFGATGGSGSYTFAVTGGSLPAWLTLNANTGALRGTPTTTGTSTFTITATDSKSGATGNQAYTLTVNAASTLTVSPATLPGATINTTYSTTLRATGGSGTYTFAVTSGSLPPGLSLNANTGVLSGTPTSTGTWTCTMTATDSKVSGLTGSTSYTVTVSAATTLKISPGTLSNATVKSAYSATLSASGGSGSYTFAVTAGSLPSWLSLNTNTGVLSGTPTTTGTSSFTITATDSKNGGLTGSQAYTLTVNPASTQEPLLYRSNLQYVGAFRVPDGQFGPLQYGTFEYGGTALAFNSANNSLYVVGHVYGQDVAQISIPAIVNSSNLNNLNTATVLQPFADVLGKLPSDPLTNQYVGTVTIGGLMVQNGHLYGSVYGAYDTTGSPGVFFDLNSTNLASATAKSFTLGGDGTANGYMFPIPPEWQAALGASYLAGQADISIVRRTSSGPAAYGFDPTQGSSSQLTGFLYYPVNNPLGAYEGPANPLQSGTSQIGGAVFVPGTSSVLFFGTTGINYEGYGEPGDYGDPNHTSKGPHSLNGQYAFQVWAYNANDLVAVKQGLMQPWQVQPYDVWNFTLPNANAGNSIGGVAFDPGTGRLYVSVVGADTQQPYTSLPLIEVFQLTLPGPSGPQAPQIGTLAATTTQAAPSGSTSPYAPGPIPAGTPVVLTAGNVYDINGNGSTVVGVKFYLDSNKDGILEPGTDTFLGNGTVSGHNWTLTVSTTGLSSGTYTIFAQAVESDGLLSDPFAMILTIA
jgi:hypothetical protein